LFALSDGLQSSLHKYVFLILYFNKSRMSRNCLTEFTTFQGAVSLDFGRFCTGFGVGVFSYVVPVFIAEIAPKALRGGLTTLNQVILLLTKTKQPEGAATLFRKIYHISV
jgi:MFS family permease